MTKKVIILIVIFYYAFNSLGLAQEQSNAKPIELPNFIIEGKEQLNVRSGIKQAPDKPQPLTKADLDTMNSLEKRPSLLLPPVVLPTSILNYDYKKGYLSGEFGRYTTLSLEGGYEQSHNEYNFFGNAGFNYSSGHVDKAEFNRTYINLNSDYLAPEKFWIFGGSKTSVALNYKRNDYYLYAVQNPENRITNNMQVKIQSNGDYSGYRFSVGASLGTMQLSQDSSKAFDNNLNAFLSIVQMSKDLSIGGEANIDLHSVRGAGLHFINIDAIGKYFQNDYTLDFKAGIVAGKSSLGIERAGLLLSGELEYRLNKVITLKGSIESNLENNSYTRFLGMNPYLASDAIVDYAYNIPEIKALIYYHPDENLALMGGIKYGYGLHSPIFINKDTAEFLISYQDVNSFHAFVEGLYKITNNDLLSFNGEFEYSSLVSTGKQMPYSIPLKFSVNYGRNWLDNLNTKVSLTYINGRFADTDNKIKLANYYNLRFSFEYKIMNNLKLFVNLENLLNNNIYIWNNYKERGLFLSAGLVWQF